MCEVDASSASDTDSLRDAPYVKGERQQYLAKNPHGYRCHANTGVKFPATA